MAWSRGAYNSNTTSNPTASILQETMLMRDDQALNTSTHTTLHHNQYITHHPGGLHHLHHFPLAFFPFSLRDGGDVDSTLVAGSTASTCSNIMQATETLKRPLFWPFLDTERVKGRLSPDHNVVNEQSGSTSEYCNVSNTVMMERMLRNTEYSNEEVEKNIDEGESRIRKKKRLTGEQVHVLESSFKADKKLEAERKQELAHRLGLEPRQVAVWFQNRRARSKTKHLEHDFALLKSKYNSMLAETHKLRSEVSRLTAELEAAKCEAERAKSGVQFTPEVPLQNSGSSNQHTTKNVKSNNIVEATHIIQYESSNLLGKGDQGTYVVTNAMKQNRSDSPSISCSQENSLSHNNLVEFSYNTSPTCVSEENQQYTEQYAPCSELVACLTEATTTRFEHVDATCSSLAAYLKKVNATFNDIYKLPAGEDCWQPLSLWELTTSLPC